MWPRILRTSSSQEEGCQRRWCLQTKKLTGQDGRVSELHGCEVQWTQDNGRWSMHEAAGTDFTMKVDLVLLSMGFVHVVHSGLVEQFALKLDDRGNVAVDGNYMTSEEGVFAAGDASMGASLVVRAIKAGREAAAGIDKWLMNASNDPPAARAAGQAGIDSSLGR